ncbi:type II secretion system protein [Amycolatopsis sp. K13G38]|uniref:Type II secretion system protein n=1 Tax=Amycolatopsis acididurans TaxID=2724524 RepID=A0ABX1JJU8_9PSEU|nr:type II secretion system F family protein [Amycolatopsis acididurans]NKQ59109.1 type II secretion system protein [Amycolatopsis acididurans]
MTSASAVLMAAALLMLPSQAAAHARLAGLRPSLAGPSQTRPGIAGHRRRAPPAEELAGLWDLLAACLRAGLPVPTALQAVTGGLPGPEADALRATAALLALGADAGEAWKPASDCPGTAELARAARRTARSGSALADVAEELAGRLRTSIADSAEARAQRAGVLIAAPLALCFLPAFLCLGVVPVVFGLASRLTSL